MPLEISFNISDPSLQIIILIIFSVAILVGRYVLWRRYEMSLKEKAPLIIILPRIYDRKTKATNLVINEFPTPTVFQIQVITNIRNIGKGKAIGKKGFWILYLKDGRAYTSQKWYRLNRIPHYQLMEASKTDYNIIKNIRYFIKYKDVYGREWISKESFDYDAITMKSLGDNEIVQSTWYQRLKINREIRKAEEMVVEY